MKLKEKLKFAMDEGRMLNLGAQVLIGFGFQSVMQPGFDRLPPASQRAELISLIGLIAALAFVVAPAARDCLVERGHATARLHRYATRMIGYGLFPFAAGLGTSVYVAIQIVDGTVLGLIAGIGISLFSLLLWYGGRIFFASPILTEDSKEEHMELKDKITHALTEARMVLPGVQAMAGFQFIGMLTDAFERLPATSKDVHTVSLFLSAITISLLITPAAFHRIVELGEATDRQYQVTNRFLLGALVTLPPAICGDLFVVIRKVTAEFALSLGVSLCTLFAFYVLWFGPGAIIRAREKRT